jgi:hypothetical protein
MKNELLMKEMLHCLLAQSQGCLLTVNDDC